MSVRLSRCPLAPLTLFLISWALLAVAPAAVAQVPPRWDYVYHANSTPDALPAADAWVKERLSGGHRSIKIENGQLRVSTAGRFQFVRDETLDPLLSLGELTIEVRSRTDASPVWGLLVGNTFNLAGSGRSSISIWILPSVMRIETRLRSDLFNIPLVPGDHVFRIARSVPAGEIRIYVDGGLVWWGGLGRSVDTGPYPQEIVLFYGDDTDSFTDYVAYAAGAWSPADLPSPGSPYRLPFEGGPYAITQGPSCPGGIGHPAGSQAEALDFAMVEGTPVHAAADGTVAYAGDGRGRNAGFGQYVRLDHPDGSRSYYAHLSQILVTAGGTVLHGEPIGLSGNTGQSTGPHLHFQVVDSAVTAVPVRDLDTIVWASGGPGDPCTTDAAGNYGYATGPPVP